MAIKESKKTSTPIARMCSVCRMRIEKTLMIRVVKTKCGKFFIDETGKADGRGAYICKSSICTVKGVKTRVFNRSFKCQVPEDVYYQISNADKNI